MPRDPRGWVLEQVISGGQTGVDQKGLEVAKALGYKTGGVVPRTWRTDAGPAPWLGTEYGCVEHKVSDQYGPRTYANVRWADGTVLFGVLSSPGCKLTAKYIAQWQKPHLENPTVAELQAFILDNAIRVLNVAGNRLRTHPESTQRAEVVLTAGLIPF